MSVICLLVFIFSSPVLYRMVVVGLSHSNIFRLLAAFALTNTPLSAHGTAPAQPYSTCFLFFL